MKIKKGTQIEVEVTDIAFGGRGLVRVDGLAVFVDQAVPGDRVKILVFRKKRNYAEARPLELIESSPFRTVPPCEYSGFCGGCKWQFLNYDQQLIYKRQHVLESLEHIGRFKDVAVHPTIASEIIFGYRNKMEFSCADRRWLLPDELGRPDIDQGFALGLHVPGTFHKVIDIRACLLQPDMGNLLLNDVRGFIRSSNAPVYGLRSHAGFWRFLVLRHSVARDQWMVNLVTAKEDLETVRPLAEMLTEKYPQVVSVVNNVTSRKAGVAIGEFEQTLAGSDVISDNIAAFEFDISANSFFQTNSRGAEVLFKTVEKFAGLTGIERVLDLYSGTGTIPILLSGSCKSVTGIEIFESAVTDAEKNCHKNGVSNCTFIKGDIRQCLSQITQRPDLLIIDPPRVGMHKDVVKQVLELGVDRMVYVSCNPATMARDLRMMEDRYRLEEVQPVDMFPHTYHIEAVARLTKI
ncbi:MAG: 23S rRNA (uracil(1939)-C(5))-methyltransferase RlmD [Desulfobacterales bacterium]|nr:MAG: 23S rRNA (uracil(1939)-C(5))-methyltransferase RlmD [Desulfobacterales bacterium]